MQPLSVSVDRVRSSKKSNKSSRKHLHSLPRGLELDIGIWMDGWELGLIFVVCVRPDIDRDQWEKHYSPPAFFNLEALQFKHSMSILCSK